MVLRCYQPSVQCSAELDLRIYGECEEIRWTIVQYSTQTWVEKNSEPQKVRQRWSFSIVADSRRRSTHNFGGGMNHFQLVVGFGNSESIIHDRAVATTGRTSTYWILDIGMQRTFTIIMWVYWNIILYLIVTFWIFYTWRRCVCFMNILNFFCNFSMLLLWNSCYVMIWIVNPLEMIVYFCRKIVSRWKKTQVENWKHSNISANPTTDASSSAL